MHFATHVRISAYSAFVKMYVIFHNTPTVSLTTVTTTNWRLTPTHMREGRTILGAKSKLLYSEITLSRKPFEIGHVYIYNFCLEWPILWPPGTLTFPPGTPCISCIMQLSCGKTDRETLEGNVDTSVCTWKDDTETEIDLRGNWST
jgi:hypothetical protein